MELEKLLRDALAPREPGRKPEAAVMARIASGRRRPLRLVVITSLLAMAAAAATLSVRLRHYAVPVAKNGVTAPEVPAVQALPHAREAVPQAAAPAILLPTVVELPGSAGVPAVKAASNPVVDPHTVVVVRRPEVAAEVQEIALADRCFDAVTAELRGLGGLNIVTDSSVFRMTSSDEGMSLPERDQTIARNHGAGNILRVTTQMGCDFALFNSRTGSIVSGAGGGGVDPQGGREYLFAKGIAAGVHAHLLGDRNTEASEARIKLLNAQLSDGDRATALVRLVQDRDGGPGSRGAVANIFDKEVLAAAVHLGTKSPDAKVRSVVWTMLGDANDPAIVQPLLRVIADDPDRSVRFQAIRSVRKFLGAPGVREALHHAATSDSDSQLELFCCVVTVREAAERAAVPDSEFLGWVHDKLLDENLPGRSRLINLVGFSSDGRFAGSFSRVGSDSAAVVFEIAQRDPDPRVRAMAWDVMYSGQADREFLSTDVVPVLLDDLRISINERVRAAAARILFGFRENSDVREAIELALSDESMMVRRAATGVGMAPASAE